MRWFFVLWSSVCFAGDFSLIAIPPAETMGYPGSPLLISVTGRSESGAEISYQWKKNGKAIPGATSHVLLIQKAAAKDAGVYSVDVKSGAETKSAETKVVMSKTKLKPQARVPASTMPSAPSCHDTGKPAAKAEKKPLAQDHHEHHGHHGHHGH